MAQFDELLCDDDFEDHQAAGDRPVVSCDEAIQAWYGKRLIVPNRRARAAPYLMLGQTHSNRNITVVILPTQEVGTWRAYTAWDTKKSDL